MKRDQSSHLVTSLQKTWTFGSHRVTSKLPSDGADMLTIQSLLSAYGYITPFADLASIGDQ